MAGLVVILLVSVGCASQSFTTKSMRKADQAPMAFEPVQGIELEENACKSPLVDPTDGTKIIMVESVRGIGDYEVPSGKYGMKENELLRIDCQTGKVLGIVKR